MKKSEVELAEAELAVVEEKLQVLKQVAFELFAYREKEKLLQVCQDAKALKAERAILLLFLEVLKTPIAV